MSVKGNISNISRGSIHDGSGIRTVVYFKGCNLKCKWCHNPESLNSEHTLIFADVKCIHCGRCVALCPECHKILDGELILDRKKCTLCGKCAQDCPTGALSLVGIKTTAEAVYDEIKKDMHYYAESGGGVTLSGGECLLQPEFAAELLHRCKQDNIHTAVETALYVPFSNVLNVLPYIDFMYVDLKHWDSKTHKKYTGAGNELVIENIQRLSDMNIPMIIRIPLIPGVNDSEEDMKEFANVISHFGDGVKGIELLKYNYLARSKYKGAGMKYCAFGDESQSDEYVSNLRNILEKGLSLKREIIIL